MTTALALLATGGAEANMIDSSGMAPWEVCGECHGLDGASPSPRFPKLAGQPAAYLVHVQGACCARCRRQISVAKRLLPTLISHRSFAEVALEKQIRDFLSGARVNDGGQMQTVVTEIATEDIPRVAAYFATLPPPSPAGGDALPSAAEAALASGLVEGGREEVGLPACRECHGVDALASLLEAQHRTYLKKQLGEFRSGARANDPSGTMATIARKLSEPEIDALASYLAARPRPDPSGHPAG
jgi:cytochrome c553